MSSASGETASDETFPMEVAEDAAAIINCSSSSDQHEGICGDAKRTDVADDADENDDRGPDEGRALSSASSDSSVAVNCRSYPTEVVVHGRKVQKVRVLFTPFPPRISSSSGQHSMSEHPSRRRRMGGSVDRILEHSRHRRYRASGSTVAQATDDLGTLPLSQEESSAAGCVGEGAKPTAGCVPSTDREEGVGDMMETKMKQEIRNGISFIEDRLAGLIRLNQKLRTDLEREMRNGEVLREKVATTETQLRMAEVENGELKQQLDCREKESMRFAEQAKDEWRRRIGLEESLMELKRDKDLESTSLKDQLDARNAEMRSLEAELKHRKQVAERNEVRTETVELSARVNQLEETVVRLQREKDRVDEMTSRLEKDLDAWKVKYETGCRDLDLQMGRFQALRKSYADLQEENKRLAKTTQRVLRDPTGTSAWPESIRIIDLPEQTKSTASLLVSPQHPGHSSLMTSGKMAGPRDLRISMRKKSQDSSGSDHSFSLPPVQKFNK